MSAEHHPITVEEQQVTFQAVRATGPGGQNVNKVSSAVHLRFDIHASSLPDPVKQRLCALGDRRISKDGIVVIKAQRFRDQDRNRQDALARLNELVRRAAQRPSRRIPTRPSRAARQRRLDEKKSRSRLKSLRGKVEPGP